MVSFKSPCRNVQNRIRTHKDHSWSFLVQSLCLVHQMHFGTLRIRSVFSTLGIIPSECWYIWCTLVHLAVVITHPQLRYNYFRFGKTNVRHIGILLPVSYHSSRHVILHQSVKFYPSRTAQSRKMKSSPFWRWRISAVLDFRGLITGFEKPMYDFLWVINRDHSSITALFLRKSRFSVRIFPTYRRIDGRTDRRTDRQTDGQCHRIKPPSLKYKEIPRCLSRRQDGRTDNQMDSTNALSHLRWNTNKYLAVYHRD